MRSSVVAWILWLVAAALLFVFTGTGAALLLLVATALLPPAAAALARGAAPRLRAELSLPVTLRKGERAQGALVVRNGTVIPIARARVRVAVLNALTAESRVFRFDFSLMPRAEASFPFAFESAHCGQLVFSCDEMRVFDFFGLYAARREETGVVKRLIPPDTFPAHVRLSPSETPAGDDAVRYSSGKGDDLSEILTLRDYAEGDSRKQVRWKLTAKYGKLIVSDPSLPLERALLLFWDGTAAPSGASPAAADALAEAFVSVCLALTEDEIPYSVAWGDPDGGGVVIKDVSGINDLYDAVPGVLHARPKGEGPSLADELRRAPGYRARPLVAYFSSDIPPDLSECFAPGRVTAFLCVSDPDANPDAKVPAGLSSVVFSPDTYRDALRYLVL
ncbi:MAG: DUF58 domain-containing protein [Clostridiales Family XIII bacterium]|jgi:uncharacterized protein (DUF58 family)|nr:DUF58 domain-containing protein [Clostridiales Family XIII bacterium]